MTAFETARREKLAAVAKANHMMMASLWSRWQDEKEHEDFADYIKIAKAAIEKAGCEFVKLDKRFNLWLKVNNVPCYIKCNSREYSWGRL